MTTTALSRANATFDAPLSTASWFESKTSSPFYNPRSLPPLPTSPPRNLLSFPLRDRLSSQYTALNKDRDRLFCNSFIFSYIPLPHYRFDFFGLTSNAIVSSSGRCTSSANSSSAIGASTTSSGRNVGKGGASFTGFRLASVTRTYPFALPDTPPLT